jgi:hypothetical protein
MKYFSQSFMGAVVFLGIGVALVFTVLWWMVMGVPVTGTAGDAVYREGGFPNKGSSYKLQIHFVTKEGQSRTVALPCLPHSYPKGGPVPVRYNPKNPGSARINSFWHLWAGALVCLTIGGLCLFDFQQAQKRERDKPA